MAKQITQKFRSPEGKAIWPTLGTPDYRYKEQGQYSCRLRMKDEDAQPLIDQLTAFRDKIQDAVLEASDYCEDDELVLADTPWRPAFDKVDHPDKPGKKKKEFKVGYTDINFKANAAFKGKDGSQQEIHLAVIDRYGKPLDGNLVRGGSVCVVAGKASCFYTAKLGYGLSLRMEAVQVRELSAGANIESYGFDMDDPEPEAVPAGAPQGTDDNLDDDFSD